MVKRETELLPSPVQNGGVAQLGEHLPCKQGVRSSILLVSTKLLFWTLKTEQKRRKQSAGPWKMSHGKATSDQSESREKRINESRDENVP